MVKRLVAISGCLPSFRPVVSRPIKGHETFPSCDGDLFYLEELLELVCIYSVSGGQRAEIFLTKATVEKLRDRYGWNEEASEECAT